MGLIQRSGYGRMTLDVRLLDELECFLEADTLSPQDRDDVVKLHQDAAAFWARREDPLDFPQMCERWWALDELSGFLNPEDLYWLIRMRGWNRTRHGSVTVDARAVAKVRNALNVLTCSGAGEDCYDLAAQLAHEPGSEDLRAWVDYAVATKRMCGQCRDCRFLGLRDLLDDEMDAQGQEQSPYYAGYHRQDVPIGAAAAWWRDVVNGDPVKLLADAKAVDDSKRREAEGASA